MIPIIFFVVNGGFLYCFMTLKVVCPHILRSVSTETSLLKLSSRLTYVAVNCVCPPNLLNFLSYMLYCFCVLLFFFALKLFPVLVKVFSVIWTTFLEISSRLFISRLALECHNLYLYFRSDLRLDFIVKMLKFDAIVLKSLLTRLLIRCNQ